MQPRNLKIPPPNQNKHPRRGSWLLPVPYTSSSCGFFGGKTMIGIESVVHLVIYLVVAGLIFWLLYWLLNFVNPPEPFKKVAVVILAILMVLVLINALLGLVGRPLIRW